MVPRFAAASREAGARVVREGGSREDRHPGVALLRGAHGESRGGILGEELAEFGRHVYDVGFLKLVFVERDDVGGLGVDDGAERLGLLLHERAEARDVPAHALERGRARGGRGLTRGGILGDVVGNDNLLLLGFLRRGDGIGVARGGAVFGREISLGRHRDDRDDELVEGKGESGEGWDSRGGVETRTRSFARDDSRRAARDRECRGASGVGPNPREGSTLEVPRLKKSRVGSSSSTTFRF